VVFVFTQTLWQVVLAVWFQVTEHRLRQVHQAQYGQDFFAKVFLKNPATKAAFEAHLMREHAVESLLFAEVAERWKQEFFTVGMASARARARRLVHLHVGNNSMFPINISFEMAEQISTRLSAEPGKGRAEFGSEMFEEARTEVLRLMFRDSFYRFLHSAKGRRMCQDLLLSRDLVSKP
jgi:hypothetical protein